MAAYNQINALIRKLRALGQSPEQIAGDIAPELRKAIEENISSARSPNGKAWESTLDGQAPLQNAAKSLGVAALGTKVIAAVRGVEARHNNGAVRGGKTRQIIPKKITDQILKIINDVTIRRFKMIMGKK